MKLPTVIQAPMAGVQDALLAAAVSSAGGLGSIPCAMLDAPGLAKQLAAYRERTRAPVNVNFFCHVPPQPDAAREAGWRAALAPYYREFGIDPAGIAAGAGRAPFSSAFADVLEPFKPEVVSFHFGLPAPELLARVRGWGSMVLASATTVEEGEWLQAHGADAVIAQGVEAGGHRGMFLTTDLTTQLGTLPLTAQLASRLRVPVIAAGGIADARAVRAAVALGASSVQVGTSFLLCDEATTPAVNRATLASPAARHTALTTLFTGRPARGVVNRVMRELGPLNPAAPAFPTATAAIAPLRAKAEAAGRDDFSPVWCGQDATGCRAAPAARVLEALLG